MGEEASEPPAIFNFALGSVKAKAAAGTGFREVGSRTESESGRPLVQQSRSNK